VEAFTTSLRSGGAAHSTIRGYHRILALFVGFVCDPRYCASKIEGIASSVKSGHATAGYINQANNMAGSLGTPAASAGQSIKGLIPTGL
jgi:hypothetical protein